MKKKKIEIVDNEDSYVSESHSSFDHSESIDDIGSLGQKSTELKDLKKEEILDK